ncbi:GGDEF domain-containing protein [Pulveribacter suum]|uniref:diguanylate cyclase n=1 Tax=Pulveribacter suum TaxID=2116657 RepID=A0A2P1NK00_9BURK|nr:GGDEF domain-containing protein [Pulveribacter suum]AVP57363.1 GGDEF domain-containing protein [Pulveribacter suum]
MAALKSPSDIARETLKQLAARRLSPTPDNYQALYEEIAGSASPPAFPAAALRGILRVMPGQTPAQKRLLNQLEQAIAQQSWSTLQSVMVGYANLGLTPADASLAPTPLEVEAAHVPQRLALALARLVDNTLPALGEEDMRLGDMATQLVGMLRSDMPTVADTERMLADFGHRLSFAAEEQGALRTSLLTLLHLLFENIAALSTDDDWLHGQVQALLAATAPPLNLRRLDEVEQRLKDVIFKQAEAKLHTRQAQEQMRELLATFIERLAQMDESSSSYHSQMEQCAERISQADRLQDITPLLEEVIRATRAMALSSRVARGELQDLRERAEARHAEIDQLRQELDRASSMARHDALTGSLNRKGFDEAVQREVARAQRQDTPLCIALLDVDDFKSINDRLGHAAGDEALVHLADVTRQGLRPQDQLARYGGEEFIIILPDTVVDEGVQVMRRLQRELTTRYFLKDGERLLITFSAGVAQMAGKDDISDAIRRADQGMYLAKRSGKNRVVAA